MRTYGIADIITVFASKQGTLGLRTGEEQKDLSGMVAGIGY